MTKEVLKTILPKSLLNFIQRTKFHFEERREYKEWKRDGCPVPPPHILKKRTIEEYRRKYGYSVFIETGTYLGEMVEAQRKRFKKVISIELGIVLFEKAKERFLKYNNITLLQGDSGAVLPRVLRDIKEPTIFWLDGHYSQGITARGDKDCPIMEELKAILEPENFNHVILIDDARLFVGVGDYPAIEELDKFIRGKNKYYELEIKNDILRFVINQNAVTKK
jgi:hypothetical protein